MTPTLSVDAVQASETEADVVPVDRSPAGTVGGLVSAGGGGVLPPAQEPPLIRQLAGATKVATGIAGSSPVVGEQLQQAVQGGNEYGNLTLTRFFALHVLVLPVVTIGLVVAHIALFRKHGVTPRWNRTPDELARTTQPFWPEQLFRDMVAMAIAFAALVT